MNRQEFLKLFRKHIRRAIKIYGKIETGYELYDRLKFRMWSMGCPFLFLCMQYQRIGDRELYAEAGDHFEAWCWSANLKKQMEKIIFSEGLREFYKWSD